MHSDARSATETDWAQILALYDQLYDLTPTPVVALHRAVARGEVTGAEVALAEVDGLAAQLDEYHLPHAIRADLLARCGRREEALAAYDRALARTSNPAEAAFLTEARRGTRGR